MTSFEMASKLSGKLYFTSQDLIARRIGHYFSKLSVAFISDNSSQTYCVSSSFAASRQGKVEDRRDVVFFTLSDAPYPGADGKVYYSMLFEQLRAGSGTWYSEDPERIAALTGGWARHWAHWPRQGWAHFRHRYKTVKDENRGFERVVKFIGYVAFDAFIVVSVIGLLTKFSKFAAGVEAVCRSLL